MLRLFDVVCASKVWLKNALFVEAIDEAAAAAAADDDEYTDMVELEQ